MEPGRTNQGKATVRQSKDEQGGAKTGRAGQR